MNFAEVIGDPIAQSKSPVIHRHWLERLGIQGEYLRTHVPSSELAIFLNHRRSDPDWRGCNVTIPHKEAIIPLLDRLDQRAEAIGAVNCVVPESVGLAGYNTDIDGVMTALNSAQIRGRKATVIGAGGGARAVIAYLAGRGVREIALLVRNPERAKVLPALVPNALVRVYPFACAGTAFGGAATIINASSLGMAGADPMSQALLDAVKTHAEGATLFDLVTTPAKTEFLMAGRAGGGHAVDGLTMLVGQAAMAFQLFFGRQAPEPDVELRNLLSTDG